MTAFTGKGVSICPNDRVSCRIAYPTVIFCDCRIVVNISSVGIFKILSTRGPTNFDYEQHTPDDNRSIEYVRLFPACSKVVFDRTGRSFIQSNNRHYEHGQGVDLLIASSFDGCPFVAEGEEVDV